MSEPSSGIVRRPTRSVRVGDLVIGSAAPVVVQWMANTDTEDHIST
ncbi:MAG: 4-hydroxy-3-methylbut-2-en-1-yl diphosphate synthase, partial [Methyloversatilis sp.]|nr:4-hydroxy-3-methylbut-2-en-1-yl diphosphate synthase [Methyloversatilis sp.]